MWCKQTFESLAIDRSEIHIVAPYEIYNMHLVYQFQIWLVWACTINGKAVVVDYAARM